MACHLVATDKTPGVIPVVIEYNIHHFLAKCFLLVTGATAIEACGKLNLCAVLEVYIKASINYTLAEYSKA